MDKQKLLNTYSKPEDKLLISKMLDKMNLAQTKNLIQNLDFLNLYEQNLLQKIILQEKIQNCLFASGIENGERKILLFYPDKLSDLIKQKPQSILPIKCIRIKLPKEMYNTYNHRDYLGGLIKLGNKKKKIGDILVFEDGADILILEEIEKFLMNSLSSLTRFSKSKIESLNIQDVRKKEIYRKETNIIVPSLRVDAIISEVIHTSRGKAEILLQEGRVFLNYEQIMKGTKQIKEKDILTVRGKGKFEISKIDGQTRNGRIKITVYQFI